MKFYIFSICILSIMLISGCTSVNTIDRETYNLFVSYQVNVGKKCIDLMEKSNYSQRDLNTVKNFERLYTRKLSELKIDE